MFHPQSIAGMDHMMQVFFFVLNMTSIYLHGHNYESFNSGNFFLFFFLAEMVIDLYYKSVAASLVSVILQTKEGKNSSLILKNCPIFFFCKATQKHFLSFTED